MTTAEIRKLIANAPEKEWFNSVVATFHYPYINVRQDITGVSAIYDYVLKQQKAWNKVEEVLPPNLKESQAYFKRLVETISSFVTKSHSSPGNLQSLWDRQGDIFSVARTHPFPFESKEAAFLLELKEKDQSVQNGAFNFVIGNINNSLITNKSYLSGLIHAYEFYNPDANITKRNKIEKDALASVHKSFQKHLEETETTLVDHLTSTKKQTTEFGEQIQALKEEKDGLYNAWYNATKEDFQKFDESSKGKIKELEETYKEKLKLEEPAKYWETRATKLRTQGWIALGVTAGVVLLIILYLGKILWESPESIYLSWFEKDKSAAIRWSVVYITIVSFVAFALRALIKVMFSSFHLARDCEERNTLTYFYLALLKDSNVDDKDRQLIMQSLFSRADTGLLKDDSSPTMPNDITGKLFGR